MVLYQGTTSVVPQQIEKSRALAPDGRVWKDSGFEWSIF
jgi:hypothetical protein